MQLREVKDSWGIDDDETPEDFADRVYGVKFNFTPETKPGYMGDLFILHGDALGEPLVVIRENGSLEVV